MAASKRRGDPTRNNTNTAFHKRLRRTLIGQLKASPGSMACPRCGGLLDATMDLHLDHTDDRTGYLGLSHALCNLRAGQAISSANVRGKPRNLTPQQQAAIRTRQSSARVTMAAPIDGRAYRRPPSRW